MKRLGIAVAISILATVLQLPVPVQAVEPSPAPTPASTTMTESQKAAALQAAAANPLAALISVPFQFNANYDVGPYHQFGYTLNVQPVVPVPIGDKMTMIFRTVVPIAYVPELNKSPLIGNVVGLGSINPQLYFISSKAGSLTIGPGVTFLLPTSTNPLVGPNKWAAGPDIAVVATTSTTLMGFIANNLWSFAGSPSHLNINNFFIQPFYVKNFAHGVGLTIQSQTTANWNAPGNQKWTVPVFLGISQLQKAGRQPLSVSGGIGYNAVRPSGTASWFARFQITLLYPTAKPQ
ncbi:MAG: hypothetical protein ABI231_00775 [Candidatus Tumulicola sp.]